MKNQRFSKAICGLFLLFSVSSLLFTSCKKGDVGPAGARGAAGDNGPNGANGTNGTNGNTILSGEGAPSAQLGNIGDFYLDITVTALYGPKTSAGWGESVSLKGPQGDPGQSGSDNSGPLAIVDTFSFYTDDWMGYDDAIVQRDNNNSITYSAKYVKRWEPYLSKDILDNGMVIVSFTPSPAAEPNKWLNLPYVVTGYDNNGTLCNYNYSYVTDEHTLRIQFYLTPTGNQVYYNTSTTNNNDNTATPLGISGPDITTFNVPDARYKIVMLPANVVTQINTVTHKQFSRTGKVLSIN